MNQALINVRVPPDAEVWFDDQKTTQTGGFRSFISPSLNPNEDFVYTIRARWTENGRPVEKTRKLHVHAGDRLFANFMTQGPRGTGSGTSGPQDTGATPSGRYGSTTQPNKGTSEDTTPPAPTPQSTNEPRGNEKL
jgi:uncharacterized protein (TIGR03000 family)